MEYGSRFEWSSNQPFLRETGAGLDFDNASYYRSGRDAMKALARAKGHKCDTVLLPALCCESMMTPFTLNGYKVGFYRMNGDCTGNTRDVLEKMTDRTILLYMRYFGIKPFGDEFLTGIKAKFGGALLAEDRTHDILVPRSGEEFKPDAMLASLKKWAALPDGGILVTELETERGITDTRYCDVRRAAKEKKDIYLQSYEPALKKEFLSQLTAAEAYLDESGVPVGISGEYRELIGHIDFVEILRRRRENIATLTECLRPALAEGKIRLLTEHPEDSGLYLSILLDNNRAVQRKAAESGVYCAVIWPRPEETKGICPESDRIIDHLLCLPCDQRYGEKEMKFIAGCVLDALP